MGTINFKTGDYITLATSYDFEDMDEYALNDLYSEAEKIIESVSHTEFF